ncbi:MAG: hypothetical protein ACK2T7_12530 [Anaerolineales bacterium]
MLKKIIIGILAITVVSAAVAATAYNLGKQQVVPVVANDIYTAQDVPASNTDNTIVPHEASPQVQAEENMGESFTALAQIRGFDATGMDVVFESGETAYIELGPEDYWRSQNIELRETDIVTIEGTVQEDMYHATKVTTGAGEVLVLRAETGQPMWSGNPNMEQGANGEHTADSAAGEANFQALDAEWVTYSGTLSSIANGRMTILLEDGTSLSFRTGQPRFFQSQGVTFSLGELVEVTGFYNGGTFSAGDIVQVNTGIRVMMLDPNGRPLWAGPGNNSGN